ncbi:hypothetical protein AOLI_G00063850 [Acnodon oligacanthus]
MRLKLNSPFLVDAHCQAAAGSGLDSCWENSEDDSLFPIRLYFLSDMKGKARCNRLSRSSVWRSAHIPSSGPANCVAKA